MKPHPSTVVELAPYQAPDGSIIEPIEVGRRQNRVALQRVARCLQKGEWPAADGTVCEARLSEWNIQQINTAEALEAEANTFERAA